MITKLQQLGDLMLRKVTPPIAAEAATTAACYNQYCCCVGCGQFWQDTIRYDRICNGQYVYSWNAGCGSCAA